MLELSISTEPRKAVTHEEFVKLAGKAARTAQGLRPLATHVRELYEDIRTLQEEDNSFCYIAEVVQQARGDRTEASEFMKRVKTYYHRDRKAVGDLLVNRGRRRHPQGDEPSDHVGGAPHPVKAIPNHSAGGAGKEMTPGPVRMESTVGEQAEPIASNEAPSQVVQGREKHDAAGDRRAMTAALYHRQGRRRVVPGG